MIRKIVVLAAVAAALAVAPAALAQQKEGVKVGLGLGMNLNQNAQPADLNFTLVAPVAIYVPVQVNPSLRIEPWLGFWTWSANGPTSRYVWDVGVGGLYYFLPATPFGIYGGGRLGLTFAGGDTLPGGVPTRTTETDFRIMAVCGAEYFIVPRFSIGAEAQLGVTFYGDQNVTAGLVTTTVAQSLVGWQTNGVLFMRYFF
jgi:hypothetical protein